MTTDNERVWQPKLNPDLVMQIIDSEAILLDKANEQVHQLNEVGTVILQFCDGIRSESEIVTKVVDRYDVPEETARVDALGLLERMRVLSIVV